MFSRYVFVRWRIFRDKTRQQPILYSKFFAIRVLACRSCRMVVLVQATWRFVIFESLSGLDSYECRAFRWFMLDQRNILKGMRCQVGSKLSGYTVGVLFATDLLNTLANRVRMWTHWNTETTTRENSERSGSSKNKTICVLEVLSTWNFENSWNTVWHHL